jgi:predicted DNA-binding mobile mystery protein A
MINRKQKLILEQTDRKLKPFLALLHKGAPDTGWVYTIRKALNMSLGQLGKRVGQSPQGIRAVEQREINGQVTLRSLKEIASAMDMELVYALVPKDGSLEEMVEKRAMEIAEDIVNRTSQSMKLEDQENPKERLKRAFEEKKNELKNEMPKFLWD